MPSKILPTAVTLSVMATIIATTIGIPELDPIALRETLVVMSYSAAFSPILNDLVEVTVVRKTGIRL